MRLTAVVVATTAAFVLVAPGSSSPTQTLPIRKAQVATKQAKSARQAVARSWRVEVLLRAIRA